jgi:hypothetical protein
MIPKRFSDSFSKAGFTSLTEHIIAKDNVMLIKITVMTRTKLPNKKGISFRSSLLFSRYCLYFS